MAETFKITGELTQNPGVCNFHCDTGILDGWTIHFASRDEGKGSPLIDALFDVEGVESVQVSGSTVTVEKNVPTPWPHLAPDIAKAIRTTCGEGMEPIHPSVLEDLMNRPMDSVADDIRDLFEKRINPALASHGGFVKLVKVEDRDVHVEMGGGCQGCASARATLRQGVEGAIRRVAPQVREIIDVTDHAAGANPYYT